MEKRVIHGNGYSGVLYGESSLSVYGLDGKEVLHTGSRNINTEQEVLDFLDAMPTMMEILDGLGLMSELLADKLKPCPFCGRSHGLLITSVRHRLDDVFCEQWSVYCDASGDKAGCGASCGYHETREAAIKAWNRRADGQIQRTGRGT